MNQNEINSKNWFQQISEVFGGFEMFCSLSEEFKRECPQFLIAQSKAFSLFYWYSNLHFLLGIFVLCKKLVVVDKICNKYCSVIFESAYVV